MQHAVMHYPDEMQRLEGKIEDRVTGKTKAQRPQFKVQSMNRRRGRDQHPMVQCITIPNDGSAMQ